MNTHRIGEISNRSQFWVYICFISFSISNFSSISFSSWVFDGNFVFAWIVSLVFQSFYFAHNFHSHKLEKFYANKNYFSFNKDDKGINIKVSPYTLSYHHPLQASIYFKHNSSMVHSKKDKFFLNVTLLEDDNCNCVAYMIRLFNKWGISNRSESEKWDQMSRAKETYLKPLEKRRPRTWGN